ncbi:MAG: YibE/F family protein [Angustibacter sp.]
MGHGHSHRQADDPPQWQADARTRWVLALVLLPILAATAVAAVVLWPRGEPASSDLAVSQGGGEVVTARIESAAAGECEPTSEDRLPNGTIPDRAVCATAVVRLTSGPEEGNEVSVQVPPAVYRAGVEPGQSVDLTRYPNTDGNGQSGTAGNGSDPASAGAGPVYAWSDFSRGTPLTVLAVVFAGLVVLVARLRGLAALGGLALAAVAIGGFMLPALRRGENPIGIALVTSILIMTVLLYLAHGFSAKTTTALLGTIFGLGASAGLASWATGAAHLNGLGSEEGFRLSALTTGEDLSGVVLCGIIVASLGVLNDVTITQTSAVWEVHAHAPRTSVTELFRSGMRVGRDHLASTVYTIVFAYAGAALPTLLLIDIYGRPLGQIVTSGEIAEEVARTLVGAIGLVLAIPVTTAIAAAVVAGSAGPATGRARRARRALRPPSDVLDRRASDWTLDG